MKPVKLELILDDKTLKGIVSAEGNLDRVKQYAQGTIAVLEAELRALQKEYKEAISAGVNDSAKMAEIQALQGKVRELREELKALDSVQEQVASQPLVDHDAAPKMKNLQMSMAQIARELPSLAMGPQMFFMAISNNIPVLQDAISSARTEYDRLTATGQKATPVWEQVLGGMVSWQTALAVGVTLMVTYGDEIADWVSSLFKGKEAAMSLAEANEKLNETMAEDQKNLAEQITLVKSLSERWKALGGNLAAEKRFLKENKEEIDKLVVSVGSVAEAENLFEKQTGAYITAMEHRAKATAAFNLAVAEQEKAVKKQVEAGARRAEGPTLWDRMKAGFLTGSAAKYGDGSINISGKDLMERDIADLEADVDKYEEIAEKFRAIYAEAENAADEELRKAGLKQKGGNGKSDKKDYATQLAEARVEAERRAERARLEVMKDGLQKRKALAALERKETLDRIDKDTKEQMEMLKKARAAGQPLNGSEENEINAVATERRVAATEAYLMEIAAIEKEWQEESEMAWIEYNRKYGTAQEQREAIAKEYARKIADAQHAGEKASLKAAMKEEIQEVNMKELTDSIDFADVFGRLDQLTTDALRALRDKLREYVDSLNGELNATDMKTLTDALTRIERTIGNRKPAQSLRESYEELVGAQKEVAEAEKLVKTAQEKGEAVSESYSQETGELTTEVLSLAEAEERLVKAQNKRRAAMAKIGDGAEHLASKMDDVMASVDSVAESLGLLGVEMSDDVAGVIEGFGQATDGVKEFATAAASGNVLGMLTGGFKALSGAVKSVGSAFGADWGGEKSRERYEQAKQMYENYIAVLDKVIDKQKELVRSMEASDFANADNAYAKAQELLKQEADYAREMGRRYLSSGASKGFLGIKSSSSQGVKQRESISDEAWKQAEEVLGTDFEKISGGRMTGLFDLSYEQLVRLRDEASGFYAELHEDTRLYIDQIIASEEAWQEVQMARKEALTNVSYDDFENGYINKLLDMKKSNADFAKDFETQLQQAILKSLMAAKYKDRIEQLYANWADAAESDGELTKEEMAKLQDENDALTADMLADRDSMANTFGWSSDSSQSGRSGSAITITEETANRLEGIGNATLDHVAAIDDNSMEMKESLEGAAGSLAKIAENSEYLKRLEDIADYCQEMSFSGIKIKN